MPAQVGKLANIPYMFRYHFSSFETGNSIALLNFLLKNKLLIFNLYYLYIFYVQFVFI